MPRLVRRTFTKNDMEEAEKDLRSWLEREDVDVVNWQVIPVLFPYKENPLDLSLSWKFGIELFIECEEKGRANPALNISGIIEKRVSLIKEFPTENDTHESGVVVGGYIKNSQLFLLISCGGGIREVSTEYGRNAIELSQ